MSIQERPLRADAERNRRRLLDAAKTLFAERGLDVSLDDIAREAGVGVGTAYRRFRSRDDIIDALFDEALEGLEARAQAAADAADPWTGLTTFFRSSMGQQARDRGLKQLLHQHVDGREKVTRMRERTMPLLQDVLDRAKAQGFVREDIELADFTVISVMVGAAVDFTCAVEQDLWERYASLLFDGLRPGASAPLPRQSLAPQQLEEAMQCWKPSRR